MGVRIISDREQDYAVMFCSTTDWAFGPVFMERDGHDADERAEAFCRWLQRDARTLTDSELERAYAEWLAQEAAQWRAEDDAEEAAGAEDDEIDALRADAEQAGNDQQAKQCELALQGDVPARAACNRMIRNNYLATMKTFDRNEEGG